MEIDAKNFRRLLFFEYEFDEAKSLEEIEERLKRIFKFFPAVYLARILGEVCGRLGVKYRFSLPKNLAKDAIAMKSSVDPPMVYFLLLRYDKRGGKIVLFETVNSWYTYEKILSSMRAYCKNAGIRCKLIPY